MSKCHGCGLKTTYDSGFKQECATLGCVNFAGLPEGVRVTVHGLVLIPIFDGETLVEEYSIYDPQNYLLEEHTSPGGNDYILDTFINGPPFYHGVVGGNRPSKETVEGWYIRKAAIAQADKLQATWENLP